MAQLIPPPDVQSLLAPMLACLPTSFASSKPPPAMLSLLSPILRQRLTLFTSSGTGHDNWLRLLCWDANKAETLKEIVENANFEPHPASGELEVGDMERISYKRFDSETFKVQLPLTDWSLTALYLWCTGSEEGDAWKLTELLPYDSDLSQNPSWSPSISEADAKSRPQAAGLTANGSRTNGGRLSVQGQDDDDDYWAQYDRTPGTGTPARQGSINPAGSRVSDTDYYSRYGDVQPAMDNYDPDEHHEELPPSSNMGEKTHQAIESNPHLRQEVRAMDGGQFHEPGQRGFPDEVVAANISHPAPASPSSRDGSDIIARLEGTADRYSASEIAIKQHISYSVKSMYRLAKGAGIGRQEFEDMVQRELETLSLLDRE